MESAINLMSRFLYILLPALILCACASTASNESQAQVYASKADMNDAVSSSSETCKSLYVNYETSMLRFKPKKKSMFEKALGAASVVGNVAAPSLIGSGVDPDTLLTANKVVGAGQNINAANNLDTMMNATSAISVTQTAYKIALNNCCDVKVLNTIASP